MSGGRTLRVYEDNSEAKASVPPPLRSSANYQWLNSSATGRSTALGGRRSPQELTFRVRPPICRPCTAAVHPYLYASPAA
jgi:hypothetical protein